MTGPLLATILWANACAAGGLRKTTDSAAARVDGRFGVAVMMPGASLPVSRLGGTRFPMQSVYKLPIAMAVLHAIDGGRLTIDQSVPVRREDLVPRVHSPLRDQHPDGVTLPLRELLRLAIVESDGTASDVLLRLVPAASVTGYVRGLGVDSLVVATTERAMARDPLVQYRNWSTPDAAVHLLVSLDRGTALAPGSRDLLMAWLVGATTFPGRIKGQLPAGTIVAHKTGTDGTRDGLTRATNDIGLITLPDGTRMAVAVFIADSRSDAALRDSVIAAVAAAAWQCATDSHQGR
jgi:beta-lactamase class A